MATSLDTNSLSATPANEQGCHGAKSDGSVWARTSATVGAAAWAGLALSARVGFFRVGSIELLFLFAPLVIVPLGIEVGRGLTRHSVLLDFARHVQPFGAALAVAAMWLPPGHTAGWLSAGWMLVCSLLALAGLFDLCARLPSDSNRMVPVSLSVARIDLAVGGAWLVASRLGIHPFEIQEPIGLLTAVHFHFAGFATASIAAAALYFVNRSNRSWLTPLVIAVIIMPFVVALGFMTSPTFKMGAALLFSFTVAGLAVSLQSMAKRMENALARVLLQVASAAVFAGMVLSATYAISDRFGGDVLTIPQMARLHGVLNAVGFCLPALLAWLLEADRR